MDMVNSNIFESQYGRAKDIWPEDHLVCINMASPLQ